MWLVDVGTCWSWEDLLSNFNRKPISVLFWNYTKVDIEVQNLNDNILTSILHLHADRRMAKSFSLMYTEMKRLIDRIIARNNNGVRS